MPSDDEAERLRREVEAEQRATAGAIGIGHDFRPDVTVYNQASGIIVASMKRDVPDAFEQRLFLRHRSERRYRPLGAPPPDIHRYDLITSPTLPAIYYTVHRVTKGEQPGEYGCDWLSIDRCELPNGDVESIVRKGELQLPEPYARGWVSKLFCVAPDESAIICSCGLERPEGGRVRYWLCSVVPRTQEVALLSRLEGIWY